MKKNLNNTELNNVNGGINQDYSKNHECIYCKGVTIELDPSYKKRVYRCPKCGRYYARFRFGLIKVVDHPENLEKK